MEQIRVLIADDIAETRENLRRIISLDDEIVVVGEAVNGKQALQRAKTLQPHVILMDINMPIMDGITATEKMNLEIPECSIIIISVQGEQEYIRKAMLAGARDYLMKPFSPDDLINTIKQVYQLDSKRNASNPAMKKKREESKPQVVTVFGTKGGVGKTTLSVNIAVAIAQQTKKKVALVDLDLQFGDVSVFLNLMPKRTIAELAQETSQIDRDLLESYLIPHISGIKVLPAPGRPEYAELVNGEIIENVLSVLRQQYDYVIIDTPPFFHETNLAAMDLSNQIILALALDLPTIKNVKLSLELLDTLHHKGKTKMIVNRSSEEMGIKISDAEESLDFLVACQIPSDGKVAVSAVNKGIPFVLSHPNTKLSIGVMELSRLIVEDKGYQSELETKKKKGFLGRIFG